MGGRQDEVDNFGPAVLSRMRVTGAPQRKKMCCGVIFCLDNVNGIPYSVGMSDPTDKPFPTFAEALAAAYEKASDIRFCERCCHEGVGVYDCQDGKGGPHIVVRGQERYLKFRYPVATRPADTTHPPVVSEDILKRRLRSS